MDTRRSISNTDAQRHYVIPPTAERPDPNHQPNAPVPAQDTNATIPNCSCQWCSDAQRRQYPIEERDAQQFGNDLAPYVNQDQSIDNRIETTLTAPVRSWAQFVPPQPERIQDNFGYAPVHERAGPSNMGLVQGSTLETSIAEGRRRLAARYFNDADAYVIMIRLEPGPSGRFQVIITLEMATL